VNRPDGQAAFQILIPTRPGQTASALLTLAHLLDADPLGLGPPIGVALAGGVDRRLREALTPWTPRLRHCQIACAGIDPEPLYGAGLSTLVIRPGVIPPLDLYARLAALDPWPAHPVALGCAPIPKQTPRLPGCFGTVLRPLRDLTTGPAMNRSSPGVVLFPAGTRIEIDLLDEIAGLPWLDDIAVAGHPAPHGDGGASPGPLDDLVGLHTGQAAVLIGNGPSLATLDLKALQTGNAVTFAFNGAWRLHQTGHLTPTWHVVEDRRVAAEEAADLAAIDWAPLVLPTDHADLIPPANGRFHVPVDWSWYAANDCRPAPGFATTAEDPLHAGQSVAYLALQLAFLMGCDPVLMVGFDLDYQVPISARVTGRAVTSGGPDPNHFSIKTAEGEASGGYFGPGRSWHLPKPDRMLAAFRHAGAVYAAHGRRLVNAAPDNGGRLSGLARAALHPDHLHLRGRSRFSGPVSAAQTVS